MLLENMAGRVAMAAAALAVAMSMSAGASTLNNGDFETGSLSGWTISGVQGGTQFAGVAAFNTTGTGASNAARFNVGHPSSAAIGAEPGGIALSQSFVVAIAGLHSVSVDVAALGGPRSLNASGGIFRLLVGGMLVDMIDFGDIYPNAVERASLGGIVDLAKGSSEFTVEILRPYTYSSGTPYQFVDNAVVIGPDVAPVPLPASLPLLLVGLGSMVALRRRGGA